MGRKAEPFQYICIQLKSLSLLNRRLLLTWFSNMVLINKYLIVITILKWQSALVWKGWLYRTFPCLSDFIVFRNVTDWYHYFFLACPEITVENGLPKLGYLLMTLKYDWGFFLDIIQETRNKVKNHFTLWHASVAKLIVAPFSWDKAGSTGRKFTTASSKKYVLLLVWF